MEKLKFAAQALGIARRLNHGSRLRVRFLRGRNWPLGDSKQ